MCLFLIVCLVVWVVLHALAAQTIPSPVNVPNEYDAETNVHYSAEHSELSGRK